MSTNIQRTLLASTLAAALLAPATLAAQPPDPSITRGLHLSLRTGGMGIGFEDDRDATGGGLGLRIGYGFTDRFTAYLGLDGSEMSDSDFEGVPADEDFGAAVVELGGRFHFRTTERWVPFAEASLSLIGVAFDDDEGREVGYGGPAGSVGAGLLFFASPTVAIEAGGAFTAGELQHREVNGVDTDVGIATSAVRIHIGVSLYPF
ncbi:hypothetical protein WI372_03160 [Gemmatimonadota bacterium DH-20]|uniref:Outer membrane protein beta-barrel domain-containing protein n=1 Tax=Gaopeijia maritima TaxID=3119007 RepID=A0ABU9E5G7_9BACT